jgi:phosphoribosylformylglycinamidine cyclo-ligase
MGLTYRESGVDIDKGDRLVDVIKKKLRLNERGNIGGFGGLYELSSPKMRNPVLVSSADGVGTKLLLAKRAGKYDTIGIDLVAMCVNDIITVGAKPLFFLDYMATSALDIDTASRIIDGILEGCGQSGCILLGGETAEMPGLYRQGEYELAGFAVGLVEKKSIVDGSTIAPGDVLIGLRSSGIHSNGFSLARKALFELNDYTLQSKPQILQRPLIEELLVPTRIYSKLVSELVDAMQIKGIAHITGGGIEGNVMRILPTGLDLNIFWRALKPQPIFTLIQKAGNIDKIEMRKTFNMGIGLVLIVGKELKNNLINWLEKRGENPIYVGKVQAVSGKNN